MLLLTQPEWRVDVGESDEEGVHAHLPTHHADHEVEERLWVAASKEHGNLRRDRREEGQKAERPKHDEVRHKGKPFGDRKEEERKRPPARRLRWPLDGYVHGIREVGVHCFKDSMSFSGGHDLRNFEPKYGLTFSYLDKIIPKLRAMHKEHPEWFGVPKPKSDKGKNAVDYSTEALNLT